MSGSSDEKSLKTEAGVPESEQETAMPDESGTAALPDTVLYELSEWCEPKPDPKSFKWRSFPRKIKQPGLSRIRASGWRSPGGFWFIPSSASPPTDIRPLYDFENCLNACAEFERLVEAEERGLWPQYTDQLSFELEQRVLYSLNKSGVHPHIRHYFAFATATPAQRCAAMLRVIRKQGVIQ